MHVVCAESAEEADRLAKPRDLSRLRAERGIRDPLPTQEEAESYPYSERERIRIAQLRQRQVIGTPAQCAEKIVYHHESMNPQELVFVSGAGSMSGDQARKSLLLLAEKALPLVAHLREEQTVAA